MANLKEHLCAKIILLLYWIGRISGAFQFTYQSNTRQSTGFSKPATILLNVLRILMVPIFFFLSYLGDPKLLGNITFVTNMSTISLVNILISIKQIASAEKYSQLVNKTMKVAENIRNLENNEDVFTQIFFVVLLVTKTLLNLFIVLFYGPYLIFTNKAVILDVAHVFIVYIELGIEFFFTYSFLGLLVTASLLENLGRHLNNIRSLKDLKQFSKVSKEFHNVFIEFVEITEWDIFLLMVYYTSTIATSLMWFAQDSENWIDITYTIYATIFLLMFNVTADNILKYSRYRFFSSSKMLTNDSIEVSGFICKLYEIEVVNF